MRAGERDRVREEVFGIEEAHERQATGGAQEPVLGAAGEDAAAARGERFLVRQEQVIGALLHFDAQRVAFPEFFDRQGHERAVRGFLHVRKQRQRAAIRAHERESLRDGREVRERAAIDGAHRRIERCVGGVAEQGVIVQARAQDRRAIDSILDRDPTKAELDTGLEGGRADRIEPLRRFFGTSAARERNAKRERGNGTGTHIARRSAALFKRSVRNLEIPRPS